jgi:hypothetical protein
VTTQSSSSRRASSLTQNGPVWPPTANRDEPEGSVVVARKAHTGHSLLRTDPSSTIFAEPPSARQGSIDVGGRTSPQGSPAGDPLRDRVADRPARPGRQGYITRTTRHPSRGPIVDPGRS